MPAWSLDSKRCATRAEAARLLHQLIEAKRRERDTGLDRADLGTGRSLGRVP